MSPSLDVTVGQHEVRITDAERRLGTVERDVRVIRDELTGLSVRVAIYAAFAAAAASAAGSVIAAIVIFRVTGGPP